MSKTDFPSRRSLSNHCCIGTQASLALSLRLDCCGEWSEIEGWQIGEAWKRRTSLIPLGRPETPDEDLAGVMTFLASRNSDYMTGQAVNIDGGLVMGN